MRYWESEAPGKPREEPRHHRSPRVSVRLSGIRASARWQTEPSQVNYCHPNHRCLGWRFSHPSAGAAGGIGGNRSRECALSSRKITHSRYFALFPRFHTRYRAARESGLPGGEACAKTAFDFAARGGRQPGEVREDERESAQNNLCHHRAGRRSVRRVRYPQRTTRPVVFPGPDWRLAASND